MANISPATCSLRYRMSVFINIAFLTGRPVIETGNSSTNDVAINRHGVKFITVFCVALFVLQTLFAVAQNRGYERIDAVMKNCPAQYSKTTTALADYISRNFTRPADQLRAAYSWVAQHIYYDMAKRLTGIVYTDESELVQQVLNSRKTVCFGYVVTLKEIAVKLNLPVIVIQGYTKSNGKIAKQPHAWCGVKTSSGWRLIDPTWAAGYASGETFVKKFDDKWYYLASPEKFIETHIPYDPVWQFSYFPLRHSEFRLGIPPDSTTARFFSFPDTIRRMDAMTEAERMKAEIGHIRATGLDNTHIKNRVNEQLKRIAVIEYNEKVAQYNRASNLYNQAANLYNSRRNNSLSAADLAAIRSSLADAGQILDAINSNDNRITTLIKELRKSIKQLLSISEQ